MARLSSLEKRYRRRRKVLQGFPWEGKFQAKEEVYKYFSGDRIQCLLCGKWFKRLPTHLTAIHDMTSDEYRELYGLPWKRGLCSRDHSLKLSENLKKRHANGFRPDLETARASINHSKRRPDQPFFTKIRAENVISGNKRRKKYFPEDFQNVLKRILDEHKTLAEVYRDPDMPTENAIYRYCKRNQEFRKALDVIYEKLPFSVQARANKLSEDKFRKAILSLQQSGFSISEISRFLGVGDNTIRRRLNSK
ncbi:MAG TPA: MucR family transcriptional regulator [Desulfatiglandales bacterium]|nr:MucR family transcriptional regulator [Desulfatiglandales bacterium]